MSRPASKLEDLKVGKTYRCCNHDIVFGQEWLNLKERKMIYENAARNRQTVKFKERIG